MRAFFSNPAIQMIALFAFSAGVLGFTVFFIIRACLKLRTKGKSFAKLAEDGEHMKARLERYTRVLSDE